MDPNFSVLLDYETEDKCAAESEEKKKKKVSTKLIAGLVGGIGGLILVVILSLIIFPRAKLRWQTKNASRSIDLDNINKNESRNENKLAKRRDVEIEKASDMEVNTTAGRFVVNM